MEKDFDMWNLRKKSLDNTISTEVYFHEREVWWAYAGLNIGFEENGKGGLFLRPVLIIRKFNRNLLFIVPLTTKIKDNPYYVACSASDARSRMAIVSQARALSSRRLYRKIGTVSVEESLKIKDAIKASLDGIPHISGIGFPTTEPEGHL